MVSARKGFDPVKSNPENDGIDRTAPNRERYQFLDRYNRPVVTIIHPTLRPIPLAGSNPDVAAEMGFVAVRMLAHAVRGSEGGPKKIETPMEELRQIETIRVGLDTHNLNNKGQVVSIADVARFSDRIGRNEVVGHGHLSTSQAKTIAKIFPAYEDLWLRNRLTVMPEKDTSGAHVVGRDLLRRLDK